MAEPRGVPVHIRELAAVLVLLAFTPAARGQSLPEAIAAETARSRSALEAIPSSPLVDSERPRLKGLLDDSDALLQAGRTSLALESLTSAGPGVVAIARAGSGWDDTGKGPGKRIDALAFEWEEVGRALKADRQRFPTAKPAGQADFVRALSEQSFGQIDEHYAVAVDYGRVSGVSSGAYYLGRAEGQMRFALLIARLPKSTAKPSRDLKSLAGPIAAIEDEIVAAYAKPGSTAQHSNFIVANSSLKLAKELDRHGFPRGALLTVLRSLLSLGVATLPAPAADQDQTLSDRASEFEKRFAESSRDESIGELYVAKARLSLERSRAGGEAAERERLRAAALLGMVVPRYIQIMEGLEK
jgi:hypothetical protein